MGVRRESPADPAREKPEGRLRFLSEGEAARLLGECQRAATRPVVSCRSPQLAAIVIVALNTGMRRSEVLGLAWERVDFARGVILLEKTKNGRRREVPMNRAVYDVLAPLHTPTSTGRVFGPAASARRSSTPRSVPGWRTSGLTSSGTRSPRDW